MLCWFQVHSRVNQPYTHTHTLFLRFPSHRDHHWVPSRVPCAYNSRSPLAIYSTYSSVYTSIPVFQCVLPAPTPWFQETLKIRTFTLPYNHRGGGRATPELVQFQQWHQEASQTLYLFSSSVCWHPPLSQMSCCLKTASRASCRFVPSFKLYSKRKRNMYINTNTHTQPQHAYN